MKQTIIPLGPYHPLLEEPEHFKLYVEGERVVDLDVEIGYNKNIGHGGYAPGAFDEVAIFNVALSADDINMIMMQGFAQVVPSVSPGGKLTTTWASLKNSD